MSVRTSLILAGGVGSRLRPLSSDDNPKQFLRIFDGASLLQKTYGRVARLLRGVVPVPGTGTKASRRCDALDAEMPRDDHPLHFVRALADLQDLLVPVEPRDGVLVHVAVAAVDL